MNDWINIMNVWIPVNKRLPEVHDGSAKAQLVMYKKYKEQTFFSYGIGFYLKHGWEVNDRDAIVSHWMPLPGAPGGAGDED